MEKYQITPEQMDTLLKMSKNMPLNKTIDVAFDTKDNSTLIGFYNPEKGKTPTSSFNGEITDNITSTTSSFKGEIFLDSLRNKKRFSLKRYIVEKINNYLRTKELAKLNEGTLIYEADSLGRVFIYGEHNKKYYIDSTKHYCMDDENKFYSLIFEDGHYYIEQNPDLHFDYFDYYYLTKKDFQDDKIVSSPSKPYFANPFAEQSPKPTNKVIDIRPYLKNRSR